VIARPAGYDLDPDDLAQIHALAGRNGGTVALTDDMDAALDGADAVYVKSWGALGAFGRPEEERALRTPHRGWRMTADRLRATRDGRGIVMHCLPVRRNVEIDDAVLDGPNSAVVDEAENRLHAQRALLLDLIGTKHGNGGAW
jgi:N-acetylornithine carbamoyltransferase